MSLVTYRFPASIFGDFFVYQQIIIPFYDWHLCHKTPTPMKNIWNSKWSLCYIVSLLDFLTDNCVISWKHLTFLFFWLILWMSLLSQSWLSISIQRSLMLLVDDTFYPSIFKRKLCFSLCPRSINCNLSGFATMPISINPIQDCTYVIFKIVCNFAYMSTLWIHGIVGSKITNFWM